MNGVDVKEVLGDKAYASKSNIDYCNDNDIKLISRMHKIVSSDKIKEDGYVFNKDAGTMQCPEGHLAMRCYKTLTKSGNYQYCYYFSMKKCRNCIHYGNCCKVGIKKKKYTITVMHGCRQDHFEFQESDYFKERIKQRYKIEAKNGELKQVHGLTRCKYAGLFGMKLQMFFTAFVTNVKRIIKLKEIELAR